VVLDVLRRVVVLAPLAAREVVRRAGAFPEAVAAASAGGALAATSSWCNRDINRDLRREAALRWTMPFCAALSSARTAARTASTASVAVLATASLAVLT
jgi:hypothetical protein